MGSATNTVSVQHQRQDGAPSLQHVSSRIQTPTLCTTKIHIKDNKLGYLRISQENVVSTALGRRPIITLSLSPFVITSTRATHNRHQHTAIVTEEGDSIPFHSETKHLHGKFAICPNLFSSHWVLSGICHSNRKLSPMADCME